MPFKILNKVSEEMLDKARNIGKAIALISCEQVNGLAPFISIYRG